MVTLYSKTVCPKCVVAKGILDENGIKYKVVNLDQDKESAVKLLSLGFMAAPIVEHDGKFFVNNSEIQELIEELT
jgi:glutaredoxin